MHFWSIQQIDGVAVAFSVRQYGLHCNNYKIDNYALFFVLSAPKCCPVRAQLANRFDSIRVGQVDDAAVWLQGI